MVKPPAGVAGCPAGAVPGVEGLALVVSSNRGRFEAFRFPGLRVVGHFASSLSKCLAIERSRAVIANSTRS